MTKSVISFIIQVRLYNKDNPNGFLFPFQVLAETESKARKLLEIYLTEEKENTMLIYDSFSNMHCINSEYVIVDIG